MVAYPGVVRLLSVVSRLRGEGGCPWDRKQTLHSLKPYLIEECYELIDAIDDGTSEQHMDELGDVLLQIALQSEIRSEQGSFCFDDVANGLAEKLIRRHPHVFSNAKADSAADVAQHWERIKAEERADEEPQSLVDGIPRHLPALQRAQRMQSRVARVGFDWDQVHDVISKVEEELMECREALEGHDHAHLKEELGDLLFATVNLCRFEGINAEEALEAGVKKFARRFRAVEESILEDGRALEDCTLEMLDAEWNAVKRAEGDHTVCSQK